MKDFFSEIENEYSTKRPSKPSSQIRPWVRYWARNLDNIFVALTLLTVVSLAEPAFIMKNETIISFVLVFLWAFVEAALLATWGWTPGKWILKVKVRNADGSKLSYQQALQRSLAVWFKGLGAGLITPITASFAYMRLVRQGITSWDKEAECTVSHETIGWVRIGMTVMAFLSFSALITAGITMK
ncbi:MAG: RDD family protein [Clostridia bacterium]|nr:RDD family protein [Clostridia bacterium]